MARGFYPQDLEGDDRPTEVSLPQLVPLKPIRRRPNSRPWRPLQRSDFGEEEEHDDGDISDNGGSSPLGDAPSRPIQVRQERPAISSPIVVDELGYPIAHGSGPFGTVQPSYGLSGLGPGADMSSHVQHPLPPAAAETDGGISSRLGRANNENIGPYDAKSGVVDEYTKVFGKHLPDYIQLLQEVGTVDGEVTFIAHPNREVTAHQWSARSFGWIEIGRYSHTHRMITGSLAGDDLADSSIPRNTIEYFKAVAEQRQHVAHHFKSILSPEPSSGANDVRRPVLANMQRFGSLSSASGSLPTISAKQRGDGRTESPTPSTVGPESLEDPFVDPEGDTPTKKVRPYDFGRGHNGVGGSMNFAFEFPAKSDAQRPVPERSIRAQHLHDDQPSVESMRNEASQIAHRPAYPESEQRGMPMFSGTSISAPLSLAQNRFNCGTGGVEPSRTPRERVAVPHVQNLYGNSKTLMPPPGLTVANPNRMTSTLNAMAPPYTRPNVPLKMDPVLKLSATDTRQATTLTSGDADTMRRGSVRGVASGLATPQNFKGPFFTDLVSPSLDQDKSQANTGDSTGNLQNWWHDIQRIARQQDCAQRLVAEANASARFRAARHPGTIGDAQVMGPDKFICTSIFYRLYENLLEYVDESRAGGKRDYFTKAWKAPALHLRDLGADGNNSFFETPNTGSAFQPRIHKPAQTLAPRQWDGYPGGLFGARY